MSTSVLKGSLLKYRDGEALSARQTAQEEGVKPPTPGSLLAP
jgi:hypothetical protein